MAYLSKYGVARHIYIPAIKRAVVDFAVSADWTPSAGDVKISKDGGAAANVTNLPTAITMGNTAMWDFSLTATEMQAAQIMVTVADSATKAVEDQMFSIETYGNASAQHVFDLGTALSSQTVSAVSGAVGSVTARVTANTDQLAGQTVTAGAGVTFPSSVASPTNITAGTITTVTNLTNAPTAGDLTAAMKASVNAEVDTALADVGLTTTITGRIDVAISTRLASAGYTAPLDAAGTRTAVGLASANLDTQLGAIAGYIDTEVGTLQTTASAIKTQTDKFAFTVANQLDVNVQSINDVTITGNGQVGTEFGVT